MLYLILISPFILLLGYFLFRKFNKTRCYNRRQCLLTTPFPVQWHQQLLEDFSLYKRLPASLQSKLAGHIMIFLAEKVILGRNQLLITDRIKLLIAAQACLLILNRDSDYYPGFKTILVYPDSYQVMVTRRDGAVHSSSLEKRLGESWYRGPVILNWQHILQGARDDRDGHNVVMHEFAHKLDEENSAMDGLPLLSSKAEYKQWAKVLSEEYQRQQHKLIDGDVDVIDSYGASSPAEFFAVVTETFFEKPNKLLHSHPGLFQQFKQFYRLDPTEWEN